MCNNRSGSPVLCNHRALINTVVGRQTIAPGVGVSHVFTVASGFRPHHHHDRRNRLQRARVCCAIDTWIGTRGHWVRVTRASTRRGEPVREREGVRIGPSVVACPEMGTTAHSWRCHCGLARPYQIPPRPSAKTIHEICRSGMVTVGEVT